MIFVQCYSLLIVIFQIPIIIAQVGYELPKTKLEVCMTTAAGTVI